MDFEQYVNDAREQADKQEEDRQERKRHRRAQRILRTARTVVILSAVGFGAVFVVAGGAKEEPTNIRSEPLAEVVEKPVETVETEQEPWYMEPMRKYCDLYGCPLELALATAETESGFNPDAVGTVGEVGIMQINPGKGGRYHDNLRAETGHDPMDKVGNIACGCYMLGKYMDKYGDPVKAAMCYNMGESGAKKAWSKGITKTEYSDSIMEVYHG